VLVASIGPGRKRPINHVHSLDDIAQEHVAMEANTAVDDLIVTLWLGALHRSAARRRRGRPAPDRRMRCEQ
jgi:hypothetical protein